MKDNLKHGMAFNIDSESNQPQKTGNQRSKRKNIFRRHSKCIYKKYNIKTI